MHGFGQYNPVPTTLGARIAEPVTVPQEALIETMTGITVRMGEIEGQVNEVIARLFNPPMAAGGAENRPVPHSASERVRDLRSRAMRINETLATVLNQL